MAGFCQQDLGAIHAAQRQAESGPAGFKTGFGARKGGQRQQADAAPRQGGGQPIQGQAGRQAPDAQQGIHAARSAA